MTKIIHFLKCSCYLCLIPKDKPLAVIDLPKLQSVNMMGYDYDTGSRIQSCYDRAGDELGKFLCKNAFK